MLNLRKYEMDVPEYRYSRRIYSGWQAAECQNHIADSVNKNFAVHSVTGKTNIEVTKKQVMEENGLY